jgi:hypothetical protein
MLKRGGHATVRFLAILIDSNGNEVASIPPRDIKIDLSNVLVREGAETDRGTHDVYLAMSRLASDRCHDIITRAFARHAKKGKCIGG